MHTSKFVLEFGVKRKECQLRQSYLICLLALLISSCSILVCDGGATSARSTDRTITLINRSKARAEVYWINPDNGELFLMSTPYLIPGSEMPLNSYVGHEFEARELPSTRSGECKSETCLRTIFAVSENDEQTVTINSDFEAVFSDSKTQAQEKAAKMVQKCKSFTMGGLDSDVEQDMDRLMDCVQNDVARSIAEVKEEIIFQSTVRKDIASRLENYTCDDDTIESSTALSSHFWMHNDDRKTNRRRRRVNVMHDRPASKIHVIENFISKKECVTMDRHAKSRLMRATVADGKGGDTYNENRKAMQADIVVPWELEDKGHPIPQLSRRVYDYANHVLGLDIVEHGQENLMSIQYFGRGRNDTQPDRYMPHCDGKCVGMPHKHGTRVATMVMYCTIPKSGGHTNFGNSGVHVKPMIGNAVFFSYIDPVTKVMDDGFTEHSGCPVYEGEKKIVTQWIRYGVDNDNPWYAYNSAGEKISEIQKYNRE